MGLGAPGYKAISKYEELRICLDFGDDMGYNTYRGRVFDLLYVG